MSRDEVFIVVIGLILGAMLGFLPTQMYSDHRVAALRAEAVKRDHAAWVVNEFGVNEFKWKSK